MVWCACILTFTQACRCREAHEGCHEPAGGPHNESMHSERGFDRLVNFSDAVVAIAITVLVLPLVDLAANIGSEATAHFLLENRFRLFVFFLSFAVIGRFWLAHHRLYESVAGYNDWLLWANLVWLLSIVFLPFPTELPAAANSHDRVTNSL